MHPRVLIVGTVPYNKQMTSRSFDAYFHFWEKDNLAQIFSYTKKPSKGHCGTLYQITDHRMLERWLKKDVETGIIYNYDELDEAWENTTDLEIEGKTAQKAYKIGRNHTPLTHLLRGVLWRKKFWCTEKLNNWLDEFKPECVFLGFSNDYFINEIALYVAEKYDIPIVSAIGDDYYFNTHFSLSPFYHIYKTTYRRLVRKVLAHKGSAIYISDKIRDKYNSEFGLDGETVYLNSEIERSPFSYINTDNPVITYFGNIRMGRNNSLNKIALALGRINPNYVLQVYSNEPDHEITKVFEGNKNLKFCGSVPYAEVIKKMYASDITVVVEGFEKKDVNCSRYSLSTKAADALSSGAMILTFGSSECGIIEYMYSTKASVVCTDEKLLEQSIRSLLNNKEKQKEYYEKAIEIAEQNHKLESSCAVFEGVVGRVLPKKINLEDKLSLMVHSCNKFSDLWDAHFNLLNKNWADRKVDTCLVTDSPTEKTFDSVTVFSAGEGKELSERIESVLPSIKTEYILVTLDDYFDIYPISSEKIANLVEIMDKEKLDYICIFERPKTTVKYKDYKNLYEVDLTKDYRVNLYPGIWRKDFMAKTIREPLNAWMYEVSLTPIAREVGARCAQIKGDEFPILDVVRKGKLLRKANRYLKKHDLYHGDRPVRTVKEEFALFVITWGNRLLPRFVVNLAKKVLHLKTFSDGQ